MHHVALQDAQGELASTVWPIWDCRSSLLPYQYIYAFDSLQCCTGTVYAALRDAQRELGSDFWVMEAMSANAALSVAAQWAARQRPMIHLPKWIRMPSKYEQASTVPGRSSATVFMHNHSFNVRHGV